MKYLAKYKFRILVSLFPLLLALGHASGLWPWTLAHRLDNIIYDARLRLTMPQTFDDRIVIVDIDEKSLSALGRWPWSRNKLRDITTELFERQKIKTLGFDMVFAEPDNSSGLATLNHLGRTTLRSDAGFQAQLPFLNKTQDYDALFAESLDKRNVVLGYYFTSDRQKHTSGKLPNPVLNKAALHGHDSHITHWDGYGASIDAITRAVSVAGFFNAIADADGIVRATPLLASFESQYYESFALAMFRVHKGLHQSSLKLQRGNANSALQIDLNGNRRLIYVDEKLSVLIPFRGYGGAEGGAYRYISAVDVLSKELNESDLKDKIVLIGSTAPGLQDLRTTPVGEAYPGVETHANILSSMLDGKSVYRPDYALGYEFLTMLIVSVVLAFVLPSLGVTAAMVFGMVVLLGIVVLNTSLFLSQGLVLPMAATLLLGFAVYTLSMSADHLLRSRAMLALKKLFGSYVPPHLVEQMESHYENYTMQAKNVEMTALFCDMRDFSKIAENLLPSDVQAMLSRVFTQISRVILKHGGTIDKYTGDCVMAFWGAPTQTSNHANQAVLAALDMVDALAEINLVQQRLGMPNVQVGIGINTGMMCVGDMGSEIRRSYTAVGDAVNLASRLQELSKTYSVAILVSTTTMSHAKTFVWQEVDKVRVHGKTQVLSIYTPMARTIAENAAIGSHNTDDNVNQKYEKDELALWQLALQAYRLQQWDISNRYLKELIAINPSNMMYAFYLRRIALLRLQSLDSSWDGTSDFS
jgi:adenylate cyclase